MHHEHHVAADFDTQTVTLGGSARTMGIACTVVGLLALAAAIGLGLWQGDNLQRFYHSYLVSYCYFLTLTLGGLFFVLVQHAAKAGWSVTVRRLAEIPAANVTILALLSLPILLPVLQGSGALYIWADPLRAQGDPLIAQKAAFLNPTFFGFRFVAYFGIWWVLGNYYYHRSVQQDSSGDVSLTRGMQRWSPIGLLLFAATCTFASIDLIMSLTPHWYSTIIGVYFFSGAAVAIVALLIVSAALLQARGRLTESVTVEHYHDLGKFLFGFVVFWGYIAFSQYLLIWYANIPEETIWYQPRHQGPWAVVSLVLLFGNLILPFIGLLSRWMKRAKAPLVFWAVWLLVMHWVDLYWLIMPQYDPKSVPLGWIDAACFLGIGGLYAAGWFLVAGDRALTPLADPRLSESLAFENT